jgi:hypothetical protein
MKLKGRNEEIQAREKRSLPIDWDMSTGRWPRWKGQAKNAVDTETETFWKSVMAFEKAPETTHFDQLVGRGVALPKPEEMDDEDLTVKLWEIIQWLAGIRVYLYHTDHLSDRELYELLWWDLLRQTTVDTSELAGTSCHLDILGNGSEEEHYLYLKYYADKRERQFWEEQYPDEQIPEHSSLPYHRDELLPKVPQKVTSEIW